MRFGYNVHSDWLESVLYESMKHGAKVVTPSANSLV